MEYSGILKERGQQRMKLKVITTGAAVFLISVSLAGCSNRAQDIPTSQPQAEKAETVVETTVVETTVEETDAVSGTETASDKNAEADSVMTNGGEGIALSALEHQDENAASVVYYTSDISSKAMTDIWCFPILRDMPWQALAAPSKIYPSDWDLRRENA